MPRILALCITFLCAIIAIAQTDLYIDGHLMARDVGQTSDMPDVLRCLLDGRRLTKCASTRRARGLLTQQTIGPLLKSVRDQSEPYNLLCPRWTYPDGTVSDEHCLSGCVATAIEQVMAYYRYPAAIADTLYGWSTENYTIENLFPGTKFDWDNYLQDYRNGWMSQQGMAIALPTLAAGMAVHMNYGLSSSGANVSVALEPLRRVFSYGMTAYRERILYTPERWHAMLRHELEQGRPIVYAGHTMTMSGHAFNIDGFDASGFYHVNWGYNGEYDGWYDLDCLCPWQQYGIDENELAVAFFCNQCALFMHPSSDVEPLSPDTLALDDLGIVLEGVDFLRPPDLQGYTPADFHFRNDGDKPVTYTYEVMTYMPTDTAVFRQADYVGLSGLTLEAGERRTQRVFLQFHKAGDRLFGISHDDVSIPYTQPVSIVSGMPGLLEWDDPKLLSNVLNSDGTCDCVIQQTIRNHASSGYAGDEVTFCLRADNDYDQRHFRALSLAAGSDTTLTILFRGMPSAMHCTLLVRSPWTVRKSLEFTTASPTEIDIPSMPQYARKEQRFYDLIGRPATQNNGGILLHDGRKIWKRR